MSIGVVLVPLAGNRADELALAAAGAVAQAHGARILALAFPDAAELAQPFGSDYLPPGMVAEMIAESEHAVARRRDRMALRFAAAQARLGLPQDAARLLFPGGPPAETFLAHASNADLLVVPHPELDEDRLRTSLVRAALRGGTLPVMLAGAACPDRIGARVCLAWPDAAHPPGWLAAILPWLRDAAAVAVVVPPGGSATALRNRLARQGIAAAVEETGRSGTGLLDAARAFGADLLALPPWPPRLLPWQRRMPTPAALPMLLAR